MYVLNAKSWNMHLILCADVRWKDQSASLLILLLIIFYTLISSGDSLRIWKWNYIFFLLHFGFVWNRLANVAHKCMNLCKSITAANDKQRERKMNMWCMFRMWFIFFLTSCIHTHTITYKNMMEVEPWTFPYSLSIWYIH